MTSGTCCQESVKGGANEQVIFYWGYARFNAVGSLVLCQSFEGGQTSHLSVEIAGFQTTVQNVLGSGDGEARIVRAFPLAGLEDVNIQWLSYSTAGKSLTYCRENMQAALVGADRRVRVCGALGRVLSSSTCCRRCKNLALKVRVLRRIVSVFLEESLSCLREERNIIGALKMA
jgi:hypothetical protein